MRLSASRTAVSALPKREPTTAPAITRKIARTRAEAKHSTARVPSACTEKPSMSLKSVMPLLPPRPMSLRKKASSRAKVIAWVMIER